MNIKFCGAASGVTGSCHLITSGEHKILLDCGQFQGGKSQEALNHDPFPFSASEIECVILSHAHIDHCGRLPLLVKRGFTGPIYCTDATADLLDVMLKDSAYIHEKEAEWQNRKNERSGKALVSPLYTIDDSLETLEHVRPVMYNQLIDINDEMKIVLNDAGHILGSAITELWIKEPAIDQGADKEKTLPEGSASEKEQEPLGAQSSANEQEPIGEQSSADEQASIGEPSQSDNKESIGEQEATEEQGGSGKKAGITRYTTTKLVFSGDLGVMDRPILRDPTKIKKADYLIMETTYGNRLHDENATSIKELLNIVVKTARRGGTTVIPSFAVGRTQELIFEFGRFYREHPEHKAELDKITVYIDSPMATTATEVFRRNAQVFDTETKAYIEKGNNPLDFPNLKFTRSTQDSQQLNFDNKPKVIISASGMCEAGRIRHHLKHNLWNKRNSIVFVGYQAEGTLGRMLVEGTKEVALFGEAVNVNAEIYNLEGFSGHADQDGLTEWLGAFQKVPKSIFLVHGEMDAKRDFASHVKETLGIDTIVVEGVSEYELVNNEPANEEDVVKEVMDVDAVIDIRRRIARLHNNVDTLLYETNMAVSDSSTSPEKLSQINDIILTLEKAGFKLGSLITEENPIDPPPADERD